MNQTPTTLWMIAAACLALTGCALMDGLEAAPDRAKLTADLNDNPANDCYSNSGCSAPEICTGEGGCAVIEEARSCTSDSSCGADCYGCRCLNSRCYLPSSLECGNAGDCLDAMICARTEYGWLRCMQPISCTNHTECGSKGICTTNGCVTAGTGADYCNESTQFCAGSLTCHNTACFDTNSIANCIVDSDCVGTYGQETGPAVQTPYCAFPELECIGPYATP